MKYSTVVIAFILTKIKLQMKAPNHEQFDQIIYKVIKLLFFAEKQPFIF